MVRGEPLTGEVSEWREDGVKVAVQETECVAVIEGEVGRYQEMKLCWESEGL